MTLLTALVVLTVGLAVGIVSGLVGIGGGVLIVPFLYFFYGHPAIFGVDVLSDAQIVLAHGTSLFIIVPTSLRGALAFHRRGLVEWNAVWPIGLVSILAAMAGARLALELPPDLLRMTFGIFLLASGAQLVLRRNAGDRGAAAGEAPRLALPITIGSGVAIGLFSAILGVGGGIVAIPVLMYLVRLDVRRVAATSMGIIAITATAGTVSYMVSGFGAAGLPPLSIGYVDVATGIVMFIGAVISVRWGARLNQRLQPRTLALMFGALFLMIGLQLVTVSAQRIVEIRSAPGTEAMSDLQTLTSCRDVNSEGILTHG
jgi:uncharacterized protein